jgi:hypothetical protein
MGLGAPVLVPRLRAGRRLDAAWTPTGRRLGVRCASKKAIRARTPGTGSLLNNLVYERGMDIHRRVRPRYRFGRRLDAVWTPSGRPGRVSVLRHPCPDAVWTRPGSDAV